jgi:hypothetical protein
MAGYPVWRTIFVFGTVMSLADYFYLTDWGIILSLGSLFSLWHFPVFGDNPVFFGQVSCL